MPPAPQLTRRSLVTFVRAAGLALLLAPLSGCAWMSAYIGSDTRGSEIGRTYFIGGAGPVGNVVGTVDVPRGLRAGGYRGSIEVYGWQCMVGWTLRDQMDRNRNEAEGRSLAERIRDYQDRHPAGRVNIIALSAGTGVAVWALEALHKQNRIATVVFLGSSLSREYELSTALTRIDSKLYCFYSADDPLLHWGLQWAGSIDRESTNAGAAGLAGFVMPANATPWVQKVYREKLQNMPYDPRYRAFGYYGRHADSVAPDFIAKVIAPLLDAAPAPPPTSAPAS